MTSHPSAPHTPPDLIHTAIRYDRPTSRPAALGMNLALGTKAKLAITNGLGRINKKLRASSFSSGTYSGVIQNQSSWNASEQRVWVVVLLVGVALLFASRLAVPLSLSELASEAGWNVEFKSLVLGSFYWGYACAPLLGHYLAERYGGETIQWLATIGWSLSSILAVQFAPHSQVMVVLLRASFGFLQGLHLPALLSVLSHRTPDNSRGFLFGVIITGGHFGSGLAGILHSLSSPHPSDDIGTHTPTQSAYFLLVSAAGVVWALLVRYLHMCSLKHHKTHYKLSDGVQNLSGGLKLGGAGVLGNGKLQGAPGGGGGGRERLKLEVQPLPAVRSGELAGLSWRTLRDRSLVVMYAAHFSSSLFLHLAMSWLPSSWDKLFNADLDYNQIGVLNVLPWVAVVTSSCLASWTCQWLTSRQVGTAPIRCAFTSLSLGGSSLFLFIIASTALTGHTPLLVCLVCVILVYFCHGLSVGGYFLNPLDLAPSPSQAGVLFGVMETVGAVAGIVTVHLTGIALSWFQTPLLVLLLIALLNLLVLPFYLTLGSSRILQH